MNTLQTVLGAALVGVAALPVNAAPLGLPEVPIPADNKLTPEKIKLGDKLFHDTRFSSTGDVSCATCHDKTKAFTDGPLLVSEGINKSKGTRNAPTVVNAAYMKSMFWDGREPDLEGQSAGPFINPVEMGLPNHDPVLKVVRTDPEYQQLFKQAFNISGKKIDMLHVKQAIASFERTIISGNSDFDRYQYGGDNKALNATEIRGLNVFLKDGRCVSCHTIEENYALFTDGRFHNIGVGFARIHKDAKELGNAFARAKKNAAEVDVAVLTNQNTSELGRFAVTAQWRDMGSFKTPTLRNIDKTAPYMHDGSLETLLDVVKFYNNGGRVNETDPEFDFLSSGIRPLGLSDEQMDDLVAFLKTLTSPEFK